MQEAEGGRGSSHRSGLGVESALSSSKLMASLLADRGQITVLLRHWQAGDRVALDRLLPVVHAELRRLARVHMRGERTGRTLQPTALVNEVYLRLAELHAMDWRDRAHFFAMASRLMRRVLVDAARARDAGKRGRSLVRVTFDEARVADTRREDAPDVLALDAALTALAAVDERKAKVVELRFFGGLTVEETAEILSVSAQTIVRDWSTAKLWLRRELTRASPAMTNNRWARIDTILQAALVRPPDARELFVKDACGDDATLCDEVLSLLAHAASADGFLEPTPSEPSKRLEPGEKLGPYTINEWIGAGGMGEVYRARDPRLGRDVAIKILPRAVSCRPGSAAALRAGGARGCRTQSSQHRHHSLR